MISIRRKFKFKFKFKFLSGRSGGEIDLSKQDDYHAFVTTLMLLPRCEPGYWVPARWTRNKLNLTKQGSGIGVSRFERFPCQALDLTSHMLGTFLLDMLHRTQCQIGQPFCYT